MFKESVLFENEEGPAIIEPSQGRSSLLDTVVPRLAEFREKLSERGALLLRNFDVSSTDDFDAFVGGVSQQHLKYVYRSTPRTKVTERVSTATNYAANREIPMHNENSYQTTWPLMLAFCCITPASEGGETPIASMEAISRQIGPEIMDLLEYQGVEYIRHYHEGVDLSWQEVFAAKERSEVESYCDENDMDWHWYDDGLLRTSNKAQGVARHPVTGERTFFNQAHLFHVSSLGKVGAEAMQGLFGADKLPRHARFASGAEIPDEYLDHIRKAFSENTLLFPWQAGDVLLLDNMRYAHGRKPYKGQRAVFAALMEPNR